MQLRGALAALVVLAAVARANPAAGQVPPSALPGREQEQFQQPVAPLSQPPSMAVQLPTVAAPPGAANIKLRLKGIVVEGSTVYKPADLAPLYANLVGKEVTADDIYALAAKISAKYGQDGYLVARVVVVPQATPASGATIRLRVVEGFIERVDWPDAANRYRDLWSGCVARITAERPARAATIERCLLLANDLPGLKFSSTIKAGEQSNGGAVLVVTMTEKPLDASVRVDDRGALGEGPWEQTSTVAENNQLGLDESMTVTYADAFPASQLQFVGGAWRQVLNSDGLAFDLTANRSSANPGLAALRAIDYASQSENAEAALTYPVIRSRGQNLRLTGLLFVEDAQSRTFGVPFTDDRLRGLRLRANFDAADELLGTIGQTQLVATYSRGFDGLGANSNGNPLASVAAGRVDFSKIEANLGRSQALGAGFSVYGGLYGQYSGSALLAAEQCNFGGSQFGRGFYAQEFVGDRCAFELGC